jgi:hypothetical protein
VWLAMDDNSVEEILSELGRHQGCPAATLLHAFGTHQPIKKVQTAMTRPGEFLALYSDNTRGRDRTKWYRSPHNNATDRSGI